MKKVAETESTALAQDIERGARLAELEGRSVVVEQELAESKAAQRSSLDACLLILKEAAEEVEEPAHMSVACSPGTPHLLPCQVLTDGMGALQSTC